MNNRELGNILMVSNYPSDTGYAWWLMEHFWTLLADKASKLEHKAYLAYPRITSLPASILAAKIETIELSIPWKNAAEAAAVEQFIRQNRIGVLYLIDQPFSSLLYAKLRSFGIRKIIIHDHTPGDRPPVTGLKGGLKRLRNAISATTVDYVLCVSPLMQQRSVHNGRMPEEKCLVVQNGIAPVVCESGRDELRAELGVGPNTVLVVSSGRAHPYKRFDFIIDCAAALNTLAPQADFAFALIGDGPAIGALRAQVERLQLVDRVRLLGFRSDVRRVLCAADVAMHASMGEGFSLAIVEYMSAGLPVLVPNIPSVSQAVSDQKTGFIYPAHDPGAAAKFIQLLVEDSERRAVMGRAARQVANTELTLERCSREFTAVLDRVLAVS